MGGNQPLPPLPKPPAPPSTTQAAGNIAARAAGQRQPQGMQSTILSSQSIPLPDNNTNKKTLLGG